jgi:nucleoside-diphosphate-sugar epimerase
MRLAVTGAGGFVGGHLVRALRARGDEVLPLVRNVASSSPSGSRPLRDVLDAPTALDGLDAIVHAAAVRHRHGVGEAAYRASNVDLVERLVRVAAGRVRRFVYVSSVGVYGFPAMIPIDESFPYAPVTTYSRSKVEAEGLVRRVATEVGVEHVIVRPTIVYGAGDTNGMLDKLARMIRAGTYLVVGDGANTLHHTHIDDLVRGLLLAAEAPSAKDEDFVLAGPETITLQRLSELVAKAVGRPLRRPHIPLSVARTIATVFDLAALCGVAFVRREPPISSEKLDVMCRSIAFSAAKARRTLGFAPLVSYEEGIRRTLVGS